MSDQGFHEIQLSGKQLVFLFMAGVVLAVVIFLLGVSVGRGVRGTIGPAAVAELGAASDTTVPTASPAGAPTTTKVTPNDLDYREKLQGPGAAAGGAAATAVAAGASNSKPAVTPNQPPPASVAESGPPPKPNLLSMAESPAASGTETTPASPKTATPTPAAKPATPAASPKPPGADAGWVVQVDALKSKAGADDLVKELKTKGYTAFVASSATLFKVRIGPFSDRSDADKVMGRLVKDGYKPLVTR